MSRRGRPPYPDVLTPREWEVLELLRERRSNDEIAAQMGISLAGAKYHVSEILGKLGVGSREEAARWQRSERPWWAAALAPFGALGRGRASWVAPVAGSGAALAVAVGIGFLIWGLVRSSGGHDPASVVAPQSTPTQPQPVVVPTNAPTAPAPPSSCVLPHSAATPSPREGQALAPDVSGVGPVAVETSRNDPSAPLLNVVRWCDAAGAVQTQQFSAGDVIPQLSFGCSDCAAIDAVQQVTNSVRELGVTYDQTSLGSGSPTLAFALLRLAGGSWTVVWDSVGDSNWLGYHGRAQFPNSGLSQIVVLRDEWNGTFYEANAGPHRRFIDTWDRQGDAYVRASEEMVSTPYASLVQFVSDLSVSNDADAALYATDASLIATARSFGLQDAPGKNWMPTCDSPTSCGETAPLRFYESAGPAVAISFVQQDGRWLISAINAAPNQPLPN